MIRAVMFDFGGVITSSPFEAFAAYERDRGLPPGFLRTVNATNPDSNAWAQLERGTLGVDDFAPVFEDEARELGHRVDGAEVLSLLGGQVRPVMVEAVRRCSAAYATACLTNNFGDDRQPRPSDMASILALFDVVLESRALGVRKPEARFYELACDAVGVRPTEVVFLDDLGINLKPARAMGMHTIKVTDPDRALVELATVTGLDFGPIPDDAG